MPISQITFKNFAGVSLSAKLDHFARELEFVGELDAEQIQRLIEIADKCPVHKTLESRGTVSTKLKGS